MNYTPITEENVEKAATLYMNHYNQHSGGCWTYEKAYKRIHQMVTMEDSLCLMQEDDNDIPTGLVIGFLESYDDFTFYYLDEILIFGEYQNKGYGRLLLQEVEQRVRERGAQVIELVCPDDAHHMHFYGGFGMAEPEVDEKTIVNLPWFRYNKREEGEVGVPTILCDGIGNRKPN